MCRGCWLGLSCCCLSAFIFVVTSSDVRAVVVLFFAGLVLSFPAAVFPTHTPCCRTLPAVPLFHLLTECAAWKRVLLAGYCSFFIS